MGRRPKNPFSQEEVVFEPIKHTYEVVATGQKLISVSTLVHKYCPIFDEDQSIIKKCAARDGISVSELRKEWDFKRDSAASRGTEFHSQAEIFINTGKVPEGIDKDILEKFSQKIKFGKKTYSEVLLYDLSAGIAGTSDVIELLPNKKFNLFDFKTNKSIKTFAFGGKRMLYPMNNYWDANFFHYQAQLSLYSYLVEKKYGLELNKMNIFWINPKDRNVEIINVDYIKDDIIAMLDHYSSDAF